LLRETAWRMCSGYGALRGQASDWKFDGMERLVRAGTAGTPQRPYPRPQTCRLFKSCAGLYDLIVALRLSCGYPGTI